MRIIHICQFLGIGGLEQVLYLMIKEQLKLGHHVELIVYDHDRRWVDKFRNIGITVHVDYDKKDGLDFSLTTYIDKKIKGFDIVHTHDLNPAIYLSILKIKNFFKTKFIHTTHGMEHIKEQPKTKLYESLIGFLANKIITVSPKFRNYYQEQFLTHKSKVLLIDNGVEINAQVKKSTNNDLINQLNLDPSKPIAIYVARVVPLKGQLELIEYYSHIDHQLLLVGPSGNDDYYEKANNKLKPNIKMLGSREDIKDLLDISDYYISHSFHEGLPISVLEAASRKIPCLLYKIPGHLQFNHELESVIIFDDKNFHDSLIELEKKRDLIIKNFFNLTQRKYSISAMTQKVINSYKDVIDVK